MIFLLQTLDVIDEFTPARHYPNLAFANSILQIELNHRLANSHEILLDFLFSQLVIRLVEGERVAFQKLFESSIHFRNLGHVHRQRERNMQIKLDQYDLRHSDSLSSDRIT